MWSVCFIIDSGVNVDTEIFNMAFEGNITIDNSQVFFYIFLWHADPSTRSNQKSFRFVIVQLQPITSYPSPDSQHTVQRQQSVNESQMELKNGETEYRQQICDDLTYVEKWFQTVV